MRAASSEAALFTFARFVLTPLIPALIALAVSGLSARWLVVLLPRWRVVDLPNERSSHAVPVARGGGLAVLLGLAAALTVASALQLPLPPRWSSLVAATALVAGVGFWDDLSPEGAPAWLRLLVHLAAALWVVAPAGGISSLPLPAPLDVSVGSLAVPLGVVWVAAVVNFVNFMDGIDGIAGAQMVALGAALALARMGSTGAAGVWLGLALAAATVGFLFFNWHPARLFLGDVGSGALGFFVAALPFAGDLQPRRGVMLLGIALFLFLGDATLTLMRRVLRGELPWKPHRSHLYQRLVIAGRSHAQVSVAVGGGALALSILAALAYRTDHPWLWWLGFVAGLGLLAAEGWWLSYSTGAAAKRGC